MKGKKRILVIILVVIALVVVYFFVTHDVVFQNMVFQGESESWKGEYRIHGWWLFTEKEDHLEYDGHVDGVLTLTYTEEVKNPPELDHFEIHYDLGPSGGGARVEDDIVLEPIYRFERLGTGVPNPDTVMTVMIDMDGDIETLVLKNVD